MTVEFIGMIGVQRDAGSGGTSVIGGGVDPAYVRDFARAHEAAGFDSVLVGYMSTSADGFMVATPCCPTSPRRHAASPPRCNSERLRPHRGRNAS